MAHRFSSRPLSSFFLATAAFTLVSAISYRAVFAQTPAAPSYEALTDANAQSMFAEGRKIFRYETFGDEVFWGQTLQLHQAVQGSKFGGVGGGLSPKAALAAGLKVDAAALPADLVAAIKAGSGRPRRSGDTLALLKLNAVVGVKGTFDPSGKRLVTIGITCASCHSTVDNSFAPGIGRRLDGWPNRDLNVGAVIALSPDLSAVNKLSGSMTRPRARFSPAGAPESMTPNSSSTGRGSGPTASRPRPFCRPLMDWPGSISTLIRAGGRCPIGMPLSPSSRCMASGAFPMPG